MVAAPEVGILSILLQKPGGDPKGYKFNLLQYVVPQMLVTIEINKQEEP